MHAARPERSADRSAVPGQSHSGQPHQSGRPRVPESVFAAQRDAAAASCNNWVTSVVSPINYSQLSGRADWSMSNATRLMLRYTQDSWKNDSPSIQGNLWGDDQFPGVDSNWDQPSKSFVVSLNQTLGNSGDQHAAVLLFGQQDRDHARRRGSVAARGGGQHAAADKRVQHQAVRERDRASGVLGRLRLPGALERGAVPQQPGSVHHQG